MHRVSIVLGGVLVFALCSPALADQRKPRPEPAGRSTSTESLSWGHAQTSAMGTPVRAGNGCEGVRSDAAERRAIGEQGSITSATGGAGSGIGRVNACANGKH
jgi:hypothetical protein